jgi:hypothetical protein
LKDDQVVAADPTLIGTTTWQSNEKELGKHWDLIQGFDFVEKILILIFISYYSAHQV